MSFLANKISLDQGRAGCKDVESLYNICQQFVLKYCHHVIWRQVDPPQSKLAAEFQPHQFTLQCQLPSVKRKEEKNAKQFRNNLATVRSYLSDALVRPIHESLSEKCVQFVTNHLLQHGDIILQLATQDQLSRSLVINAKHIVYRRWSVREERSLHRYLNTSSHMVTIKLPGKADDRLLNLISLNCPKLEELDISHSNNLTDEGLLALCGVKVTQEEDGEQGESAVMERGQYCRRSGKFVRAAASRAIKDIKTLCANQQQNTFLQDLAQGTHAFNQLKDQFPHLEEKLLPIIKNDRKEAGQHSWRAGNKRYEFSASGCKKLKKLDIWATNYPKSVMTRSGDIKTELGLTKEGVLVAAVMLKQLVSLKYNDLGDILQLYEHIYSLHSMPPPSLHWNYFSESRLTLDKLTVARKLCASVSSFDISMFNFSFYDPEAAPTVSQNFPDRFSESSKLLFDFNNLKDLEIQFMDDSRIFQQCLASSGSNLTRLCLNKMISISFETLSTIKLHCQKLQVLDVYVDSVFTNQPQTPLGQVVAETPNTGWTSLRSLKLGGSIPSGSVLEYMIKDCPNVKVLCYTLYDGCCDSITDEYMEKLFQDNPLPHLTAFYCEKSNLSISTFYMMVNKLPNLKYIGVLSEWGGLDRAGVLAIKAFVLGNNLNIDIESALDQYYL